MRTERFTYAMSDPLDYASPAIRAPLPLWQQLTLIPLYYLGWTVGCSVWFTYLMVIGVNAVKSGSAHLGLVYASLGLGGMAGAALAYLGRRRRWPQVLLTVLGALAASFAVYAVVDMYRSPRGMLWDFFFRLVLIMLAGAIGMLIAGTAGVLLTRRR
jgi:hypothetical protein